MTTQDFAKLVLALSLASAVSACGPDQTNRIEAQRSNVPAPPAKPDNVSSHELSAGIEAMSTRVLRTIDAYNRIEPADTFRYSMHPTVDKDAVIEFDVSGLSSVTLSPRIGDLAPDRNCLKDPEAGVVEFSYAVDDATPTRVTVDRNYDHLHIIKFDESKRLTVSVNHGNGVVTCDWFGLGLSHVSGDGTE